MLVNEVDRGNTPLTLSLKRNRDYVLTFSKDGYEEVKFEVNRKIVEGPQGRNDFTTIVDPAATVALSRLENDWVYNLRTGIRVLLAKKAGKADVLGTGEPGSDNRIIENWYNAFAYFNGYTRYDTNDFETPDSYCPSSGPIGSLCGNDPGFPYRRDAFYTSKRSYPYQETVYNAIAQRYSIPSAVEKGFPDVGVKVTLPGPAAVGAESAGAYDYAWPDYTGSKYLDFYVDENGYGAARKSVRCDNETFDEVANCDWDTPVNVRVHRVAAFSDHMPATIGTSVASVVEAPIDTRLGTNRPNPFSGATIISFSLSESQDVRLEVYDLLGRRVATLVDGYATSGTHDIHFEAGSLPAGVYVYRLAGLRFSETRSMTHVR